MGQLAVVAILLALALRFAHRHGFLRGWKARDRHGVADAETVNALSRIDGEARSLGVVRGSYRSRRTPIAFPIPVDPDHQSHVDH